MATRTDSVHRRYWPLIIGRAASPDALRSKLRQEPFETIRRALALSASTQSLEANVVGRSRASSYANTFTQLLYGMAPTLRHEISWLVAVSERAAPLLRDFCSERTVFESNLMRGKVEEAGSALQRADQIAGPSIWSITASLLLAQKFGGLASNRDSLQRIISQGTSPIITLITELLSQRAEAESSYASHHRRVADLVRYLRSQQLVDFAALVSSIADPTTAIPYDDARQALWISQALPLVDRYDLLVQVLTQAAASQLDILSFSSQVSVLRKAVPTDCRVELLAALVTPEAGPQPTPGSLLEVLDSYTSGDYRAALETAVAAGFEHPDQFEWLQIEAACRSRLGLAPQRTAEPTDRSYVVELLFHVERRDSEADASLQKLMNYGSMLTGTQIGRQMMLYCATAKSPTPLAMMRELAASRRTPRLAFAVADQGRAIRYLSRFPPAATVNLFAASRRLVDNAPADVSAPRYLRYLASAKAAAGDIDGALRSYEHSLEHADCDRMDRAAAVEGKFAVLVATSNAQGIMDLLAGIFVADPALLSRLDLSRAPTACVDILRHTQFLVQRPLNWLLGLHVLTTAGALQRDSVRCGMLLEDAILEARVTRPSELLSSREPSDPAVVPVLRYVAVPDILDELVVLGTLDSMENERVRICQELARVDASNGSEYSREIVKLMHDRLLRDAQKQIIKSKVMVSDVGVVASLGRDFEESFTRFRQFSRLSTQQRESFRVQGVDLRATRDVLIVTDATDAQFASLFDDVRQKFIYSSEFGLDSYLSVRIRHGTLSGQIRGLFEREKLVTKRNASDGVYDRNVFWIDRFPEIDDDRRAIMEEALAEFSLSVDTIIRRLRDEIIQIRGGAHPSGLFDYDFSHVDTVELYAASLVGISTADEYAAAACRLLWKRTAANLLAVENYIRDHTRAEILSSLDALRARIQQEVDIRATELEHAILRTRTDVHHEIDLVASWFRSPTANKVESFSPKLLVDSSVATLRKCFPSVTVDATLAVDDEVSFAGSTLVPLADLIFLLLENAIKHSGCDDPRPSLRLTSRSDLVQVAISNAIPPGASMNACKTIRGCAEAAGPQVSSVVTRTEGGSGYHKLHKILRYDLGVSSVEYRVTAESDGDRVVVVVELPRKSLVDSTMLALEGAGE